MRITEKLANKSIADAEEEALLEVFTARMLRHLAIDSLALISSQ